MSISPMPRHKNQQSASKGVIEKPNNLVHAKKQTLSKTETQPARQSNFSRS